MKFIVDAQLPKKVSEYLCSKGYDCIHTLNLVKKNRTSDTEVIEISAKEKRIVITKDSDFLESFIIKGEPEKLLLVKTGNISNNALVEIFEKYFDTIMNHLIDYSLIELNNSEIIVHK